MKFESGFGVLGGDARQIAMAESIASDGYAVTAFGFDNVDFLGKIKKADLKDTVKSCENIILPLPVTRDGVHLKMDYSNEKIVLNDAFAKLFYKKRVFGGGMEHLSQTSTLWQTFDTHDYSLREEFAVKNAVPTAEGAIEIAIREFPGTLNGSHCLVTGFGRIGKVLSWMLRGIGANVTVSARKLPDLAWIKSCGYSAVLTQQAGEGKYDLVFNTVPAFVFSRSVLMEMKGCPLMIDLASLPGGIDLTAAKEKGICVIQALALPGKIAPKAAGEIIKDTIYHMLKEGQRLEFE
ncbi:MAG: dipicolinate synthase [Oscillospiraceae bacterium]|jgi:dipicolinate synthase subunit A|nr:dipicolinate synthase [Oscillospiraceae bacterium]